ncbi:hypothetical protein [Sphaerisporangium sp. TRM90804]|uniref:hypothetical protein n=1 Tax=Sphaerisporangium sp. TRM90804 TaxID=3031113 RepID=UPI0024495E32|nr:hypothetical protein [Sphaerisporangium sp. TRM90804]MDH2424832.1 hypothetical protein [Sphaerisporangium sp. TRM90804]
MSTETPEKSFYQAKREKIAAALVKWQNDPTSDDEASNHPFADADALDDCLRDRGLQILPTGPNMGRWRVLLDGHAAPYPGQTRPSGPVDADTAVEMFLVAALGAELADEDASIVIRPATDREMVRHAVGGDTAVDEPPVELDATLYAVTAPADGTPFRTLVFTSEDGKTVRARLPLGLFELFAGSVHDEAAEIGGDAR